MAAVTAAMVKELRERTGLGMMECKNALVEAGGDIEAAIEELRKSSGMQAAKKAGRTAAEGVVAARVAEDGSRGVIIEVNSETDFVARDDHFRSFVDTVVEKAFNDQQATLESLTSGELEKEREALVQKIGENIGVRRLDRAEAEVVGSYVHSNFRIGVLVALKGGSTELARDVAMHVAAVNPRVATTDQMPEDVVAKEREIYSAQAADSGKPANIVEKMVEGRLRKFLAENTLVEQPFVKNPDQTVGQLLNEAGAEILGFVRYEVGEGIEREEVDFASEVAAQLKS